MSSFSLLNPSIGFLFGFTRNLELYTNPLNTIVELPSVTLFECAVPGITAMCGTCILEHFLPRESKPTLSLILFASTGFYIYKIFNKST